MHTTGARMQHPQTNKTKVKTMTPLEKKAVQKAYDLLQQASEELVTLKIVVVSLETETGRGQKDFDAVWNSVSELNEWLSALKEQ